MKKYDREGIFVTGLFCKLGSHVHFPKLSYELKQRFSFGDSEVAQWVEALATKLEELSSIPGILTVERENGFL